MAAFSPLQAFRYAVRTVPAYRRFLAAHGVDPERIRTFRDWLEVPLMEKANYLRKYPFKDLFPGRKIPPMIYASSGSSGVPTFWFRGDAQEDQGADMHERIFRHAFGIRPQESTLLVICFSMGVWVAGNFTLAAGREIARRGWRLSTITPGLEREDILNALSRLPSEFENLILAGYPPFLMDVVSEARARGIRFRGRVFGITAGDKFSEEWRGAFLKGAGIRRPEHVVSIYGSADAGVMGHETPLTVFLRRHASAHPRLYRDLFGEEKILPALVQYDPASIFFERVGNELVLSAATALPLIRYNIHDQGELFSFEQVRDLLRTTGLEKEAKRLGLLRFTSPCLVKKQRSDVAVTFYALNIYPENIKAGLEDPGIRKLVSGQFFAFNKDSRQHTRQKLYIEVELAQGVKPLKSHFERIRDRLVQNLARLNMEFRKLHSTLGKRALPSLILVPYGRARFTSRGGRGILGIRGKKMRIVDSNHR